MPRNSTGKYFLPDGNPVADGELITAEWANSTLSDIATAITDSLDREGLGGMNAPLEVADGSLSKPGMNFTNESNTGLYRPAAKTMGVAVGGVEVATVTQSGMQLKADKQLVIPQAPVDANDAANKTYVDNAKAAAESHADTAASNAESSAKTYADGVLTDAKSYTDTAKSDAESYADTAASTAQSNAEEYADGKFAPINAPVFKGDVSTDHAFISSVGVPNGANATTGGYAFQSDGDTGMFSPSDGNLQLWANNKKTVEMDTDRATFSVPISSPKQFFLAAGGNEGDLSNAFQSRLSQDFTATGKYFFAVGRCSFAVNGGANDFYIRLELYDLTANARILYSDSAISAADLKPLGYGCGVSAVMSFGNCSIGHRYRIQLLIRKNRLIGPVYPRDIRIAWSNE